MPLRNTWKSVGSRGVGPAGRSASVLQQIGSIPDAPRFLDEGTNPGCFFVEARQRLFEVVLNFKEKPLEHGRDLSIQALPELIS